MIALVPLVVLVGLLALDIGIFGSNAILGASQVSLLVATGICVVLSGLSLAAMLFVAKRKERT